MKRIFFGILTTSLILAACSKSDSPAPVASDNYMSLTAGSSWNYAFTDNMMPANSNNYTVTSTNRDTTAAGKSYHVFTNSNGNNEYYNITGSDYFTLQAFSLGGTDTTLENLYLKGNVAVNTSWAQSYTINAGGLPVQVTVTNNIQENDISKTVGTTAYSNVIHVVTTITIPTLATLPGSSITTDIHYYYAPKYGMIENDAKIDLIVPLTIDQHTNTQTKLQSATIL